MANGKSGRVREGYQPRPTGKEQRGYQPPARPQGSHTPPTGGSAASRPAKATSRPEK